MIMILRLIIFTFLSTRECTQNYGKVSIENKSNSTIRVTLSPAKNWNHYEQQTNFTLFRNPDEITGGNIIIPGRKRNLYFPLLNDSTQSSQIQLANVYDLQGNNIVVDELVFMGQKYEFDRFPPSIYALIETDLELDQSVKTDGISKTVRDQFVVDPKSKPLGWCFLEHSLISGSTVYVSTIPDRFVFEKLVSTSKDVIFINSHKSLNFDQSLFLCKSICGRLFKPTSQNENDEVPLIMKRIGATVGFHIRLSDRDKEGNWQDPEDNNVANFTNWASGQPSNFNHKYDYAWLRRSDGKWTDSDHGMSSMIVCELP